MSRQRIEGNKIEGDDVAAEAYHQSRQKEASSSSIRKGLFDWWQPKTTAQKVHDISYAPLIAAGLGLGLTVGLGGPAGLAIAFAVVFFAAVAVTVGSALADKELREGVAASFSPFPTWGPF